MSLKDDTIAAAEEWAFENAIPNTRRKQPAWVYDRDAYFEGAMHSPLLARAIAAMRDSVARSDDYGDSYCSQPIRQALADIEEARK